MTRDRMIEEMREKRRETMMAVAGLHGLRTFPDPKEELLSICEKMADRLGHHVEMKMLGQTVRTKKVSAGRFNYFWMTISQGDERMVAFVWPPLFKDGVRIYATSETFIDRVRLVASIVDDDDIDFS